MTNKIFSILFVCTGNICRSPMGEGLLKDLIKKEGIQQISISSAGTRGLEGEGAASSAVKVCKERGIDISAHVAKKITKEMIQENDLILTMEIDHWQKVVALVPEAQDKVRLLSRYKEKGKELSEEVPDPYGRRKRDYINCFEQMEVYIKNLVKKLMEPTALS